VPSAQPKRSSCTLTLGFVASHRLAGISRLSDLGPTSLSVCLRPLSAHATPSLCRVVSPTSGPPRSMLIACLSPVCPPPSPTAGTTRACATRDEAERGDPSTASTGSCVACSGAPPTHADRLAQPCLPTAVPKCWDDPCLCDEGSSPAGRRSDPLGPSRSSSVQFLCTAWATTDRGAQRSARSKRRLPRDLFREVAARAAGLVRERIGPSWWPPGSEEVRLPGRFRVRFAHYRAQKEACGVRG
jgi:hypothetical protein